MRKICTTVSMNLEDTRKDVQMKNKHKKLYKSMNMHISIDNIRWRLIQKDVQFMLVEIAGVSFVRYITLYFINYAPSLKLLM